MSADTGTFSHEFGGWQERELNRWPELPATGLLDWGVKFHADGKPEVALRFDTEEHAAAALERIRAEHPDFEVSVPWSESTEGG